MRLFFYWNKITEKVVEIEGRLKLHHLHHSVTFFVFITTAKR